MLRGRFCLRALSSAVEPSTQEEETEKDGTVDELNEEEVAGGMREGCARLQLSMPDKFGLTPVSESRVTWIRLPTRWLPKVPDSGRLSPPSGVDVEEGAGKGLRPTRCPKPGDSPTEVERCSSLWPAAVLGSGLPGLILSW